jgi:hypothetical protein
MGVSYSTCLCEHFSDTRGVNVTQCGRAGGGEIFLAHVRGARILADIPIEACTTARRGVTRTANKRWAQNVAIWASVHRVWARTPSAGEIPIAVTKSMIQHLL